MATIDLGSLDEKRRVEVRAVLNRGGIKISDDLWRTVGPDFYAGLLDLACQKGVAPEEVVDILATSAIEKSPHLTKREVLISLMGLLLLIGILYRILPIFLPPFLETRKEIVTAKTGLPAYHLVRKEDLALRSEPSSARGISDQGSIVGRYLLKPVALGQIIQQDQLSPESIPKPSQGKGLVTLSVRLAPGAFHAGIVPGSKVTLIFSARNVQRDRPPAVEAEAFILAVHQEKESVQLTVAMDSAQRTAVSAALGNSQVFLAQ